MTIRDNRVYIEGETVVGRVDKILPFGVFVRLEDGTRAYIRRRELSWEGDIEPYRLVSLGDKLAGIVIDPGGSGRSLEISHRATLPNPWQEFAQRFGVGDTVAATIKDLVADGAYAQILPGVNGFIPLEELAPWQVERPNDLLVAGDHIEAVITRLVPAKRRVLLSIRQLLEQLKQADNIIERLHQKAGAESLIENEAYEAEVTSEEGEWDEEEPQPGEIERLGRILVVEDDDNVRMPLIDWLCNQGFQAEGAETASIALEHCQKQHYGLVLVDLDLPEVDGIGFIRQLRRVSAVVPVALMSSPEWLEEHVAAIQRLDIAWIFPKPLDLDDMRRFLHSLARGEKPEIQPQPAKSALKTEDQAAQGLAAVMHSGLPLSERFHRGLMQLLEATQAEKGIVFHLDQAAQAVSIVAQVGPIPMNLRAAYSLVDSPVKDLIREGGVIWENQISQEPTARFRKLLDFLPFESCIGVPIEAGGQVAHALFLFHREPDAFSRYRVRDAWAMATLFAVALESQALDERIQNLSRILLSGHLAAAFGHEVYNKLSSLDLQFRNLRNDFEHLGRKYTALQDSSDFLETGRVLDKAVGTALDLKRTVADFRRLMETSQEKSANVNQVVHLAEALIRPLARRAKVEIHLELAPDLPTATGSTVGLQQVFLNLMLNAIQHMENKPDERRVLQVVTVYEVQDGDRPIKVRFSDTGPGIHRQLWEKIFALGFTTKPGGSGLGLYIARILVESMGGRIFVEESLVPLGTTFLVELPKAIREE
ncbi:MAG: ATP-binding protein [Anaerolineae bacterium]